MLASHQRSLDAARGRQEPAGQIAARELELVRIKEALQRAEELSDDVAAAIEGTLRSWTDVDCEFQRTNGRTRSTNDPIVPGAPA